MEDPFLARSQQAGEVGSLALASEDVWQVWLQGEPCIPNVFAHGNSKKPARNGFSNVEKWGGCEWAVMGRLTTTACRQCRFFGVVQVLCQGLSVSSSEDAALGATRCRPTAFQSTPMAVSLQLEDPLTKTHTDMRSMVCESSSSVMVKKLQMKVQSSSYLLAFWGIRFALSERDRTFALLQMPSVDRVLLKRRTVLVANLTLLQCWTCCHRAFQMGHHANLREISSRGDAHVCRRRIQWFNWESDLGSAGCMLCIHCHRSYDVT